jgi:hypothetical protein
MQKFAVESNAKLVGTDSKGEHWLSVTRFPFLQTDDWWFKNNTLSVSRTRTRALTLLDVRDTCGRD